MATLDSFFPKGATRGDGRKFAYYGWSEEKFIEPIFKDSQDIWVGTDEEGCYCTCVSSTDETGWQEWTPPKKTKKVKIYKPVIESYKGHYTTQDLGWHSDKEIFTYDNIVGWMTCEAEIEVEE